ncbi:hypothetical protein ACLMJK_006065 [Lecanora helva]
MSGLNAKPAGRLADKVAIVTGSSSGIGRAIALAYVQEGARVVCADISSTARPEIDDETATTTLELLKKEAGSDRAIFCKTDVSKSQEMKNLVGEAVKSFGRLDIMVNNAGIVPPPSMIHETSEESWDRAMEINARSVFLGSKHAITQMLKQEPHPSGHRGWIVNTASIAGVVAVPNSPSYCASKGAIVQTTKQVAIDYGKHNIHSNAICPGYTYTGALEAAAKVVGDGFAALANLHPLGGFGKAQDVAQTAVFLASSDAKWVTGVALPVDGGYTAHYDLSPYSDHQETCMTSNLLGRALGVISSQALQRSETSNLLHALQAAPGIKLDGNDGPIPTPDSKSATNNEGETTVWAHKAGVNCLTIDRFEGRYLLTGGADSSILLWDLESASNTLSQCTYRPLARTSKGSSKFGITHLSFYPFDSQAFLSTSYDHTLKLYATEHLTAPSASFDLDSVIYSHALSPVADHLLVACATQLPAVRLVDLRSGASAHSLAGHQGAVLSVAWSPVDEYILASGGSDGTVRLWDVRRSAGSLGVMDLEDSVGVGGEDGLGSKARARGCGKAHVGACNGVVWTDDGRFLVTAGHDERVRVWDLRVGANALSHFGPIIKNTHLSTLLPLTVPSFIGRPGDQVMLYPNEKEILMFDLFEGTLLKRLKVPGVAIAQTSGSGGQRNIKNRVTSLAWRAGDVEVYSAHSDGVIRAWKAKTKEETEIERDEVLEVDETVDESRKRKRKALDDVFRDLTRQKITFT